MSTPIKDGGPAFPCVTGETGYGHCVRRMVGDMVAWDNLSVGMSLRDWLAGKAMAAMLSSPHYSDMLPDDRLAGYAYAAADAMLAAREAKQP